MNVLLHISWCGNILLGSLGNWPVSGILLGRLAWRWTIPLRRGMLLGRRPISLRPRRRKLLGRRTIALRGVHRRRTWGWAVALWSRRHWFQIYCAFLSLLVGVRVLWRVAIWHVVHHASFVGKGRKVGSAVGVWRESIVHRDVVLC